MLGWIRHLQLVVACILVVSSAARQPQVKQGTISRFSKSAPLELATLLRFSSSTEGDDSVAAGCFAVAWAGGTALLYLCVLKIKTQFAQGEIFCNWTQQTIA